MPTPPIPVPAGQSIVWLTAGTHSASAVGVPGHGTATATATTGALTQDAGSPLNPPTETANWGTYLAAGLSGIHAVYAVADVNGSNFHTVASLQNNAVPLTGVTINGTAFSGQMSLLLGTTSAAITGANLQAQMTQTLSGGYPTDSFNITWIGLAAYIDAIPAPSVTVSLSLQQHKTIGFN